ncbi:MAG: hypothetical protein ACP5O1_12660, partial [Phycisphaerae bacterium]
RHPWRQAFTSTAWQAISPPNLWVIESFVGRLLKVWAMHGVASVAAVFNSRGTAGTKVLCPAIGG